MFNSRLINTKVAGGGGCTDIVDNYNPFGGGGVALYQLNGNATDVSGNYNGTAGNVTYGTGVFGQAGVFNNSSVTLPASLATILRSSSAFTVSVWFKASVTNSGSVVSLLNDIYIPIFLRSDNKIEARVLSSSATQSTIISSTISSNTWYNLCFTGDSSKGVSLYLNNIFQGNQAWNGTFYTYTDTNYKFNLLGYQGSGVGYYTGSIDQVRFFNTALDPLEVEALYTEELCICDGTVDTLNILGDGSCIATYPLDGNANDLSGNYSGTPTDVSYGVGEFDLAGVFNGSTSGILINDAAALRLTASYTVSFWFKINSTGSLQRIINKDDGNDYSAGYSFLIFPGGSFGWSHNDGSSDQNWGGVFFPSVGVWYNVSAVYSDSSNLRTLYVNGASAGTIATNTNIAAGTDPLNFGYIPVYNQRLNGSLDQVRIFNKALNSTEVTTLYNETACTNTTREAGVTQILGDSSCVAYYKLDGNGIDSANNNNASLSNLSFGNGEFDFAGVFNGSSSRAYLNNVRYSFPFSISLWFKSIASKTQDIYTDLGGGRAIYLRMYSDGLIKQLAINSADGAVVIGNSTPYNDNQWHNIIGVFNSNSLSLYIDGQNVANSTTFNYGSRSYGANPNIGVSFSGGAGGGWVDGSIDQVRIFNKAVSASEVTTLYNEGI